MRGGLAADRQPSRYRETRRKLAGLRLGLEYLDRHRGAIAVAAVDDPAMLRARLVIPHTDVLVAHLHSFLSKRFLRPIHQ